MTQERFRVVSPAAYLEVQEVTVGGGSIRFGAVQHIPLPPGAVITREPDRRIGSDGPAEAMFRYEDTVGSLQPSSWGTPRQGLIQPEGQPTELWPPRDEYIEDQWEDDDELLEQVYGVDRPEPCVYGHYDCAATLYGPCAAETYARLYAAKHGGK